MTSNRYIVLNCREACDAYIYDSHQRCGDIIIPVGPEALHLVKERNLPALYLADLLEVDDVDAHQTCNAHFIQKLVDRLNEVSVEYDPHIHFGDYFRFQFLVIFWPILNDAKFVSALAKKVHGAQVLVFCDMSEALFMKYRLKPGTYLPRAIANSPEFKRGQVATVPFKPLRERSYDLASVLKDNLPDSLVRLARWARDKRRFSKFSRGGKRLLLAGGGFEWFEVVKYPEFSKNFSIKQMPLSALIMFERKAHDNVLAIKIGEMLNDIASPICPGHSRYLDSLATILAGEIVKFSKMKGRVDNFLEKHHAVVSSVLCYPEENFIAHRARLKGYPVLVWQHGEKGFSHDTLDYQFNLSNEFLYATDYLAFGDIVADLYRGQIGKNHLTTVNVVGLQRDLLLSEKQQHVVYATGKWCYSAINDDMTVDADRRLYEAQKKILAFLDTSNFAKDVIFKLNNTAGLNIVPIEVENVNVDANSRFTSLLPSARAVILDTPSTTLIEASQFDVPIFVLAGRRTNYRREFTAAAKKRVCWCETPEVLIDRLSDYFRNGHLEADSHDQTFIKGYLISGSAAEVAERVNQCVAQATLRRN